MTDALHRCEQCGVTDENAALHTDGWRHPRLFNASEREYIWDYEKGCQAALKRELAAANALIARCVPSVERERARLEKLALQRGDDSDADNDELVMSALLADIQRRGGKQEADDGK